MSIVNRKLRGYEAQVYMRASGSSSARVKVAHLSDVSISIDAGEIDASDHDTDGWEDNMSGRKKWTATAKLMYMTDEATHDQIFDAVVNNEDLEFEFRPADAVGEKNLTGTGSLTKWSLSTGNSNADAVDISISGRTPLVRGTVAAAA